MRDQEADTDVKEQIVEKLKTSRNMYTYAHGTFTLLRMAISF